ncbi:MAG: right-handed parallel beta-helix repeat-containing protein [Verrucomicrobiae bacterium]|nr:right-handed parallel beta-helix repeat-containing protein [Verrucomicrobiae bacterium]
MPDDYPTIQSAMNNISPFAVDKIVVGPGLYTGSVQFGTKRAHVVSAAGPSATFITAPGATAVSFEATVDALLGGFTITNSNRGIYVKGGSSQVITSNLIVNCGTGAYIEDSHATVLRNNVIKGCLGWAVECWWGEGAWLEGNAFVGNGGGISLWAADGAGWLSPGPEIRNNMISSNRGDGLNMANTYKVNVIQNLVTANGGNGLSLKAPAGGPRGPWAYNNTIADNGRAGIDTSDYATETEVMNNVVVGNPPLLGGAGIFHCNNFYATAGAVLSGPATNVIGSAGNISTNPYLVCQPGQNFHLLVNSPCIDAGTNAARIILPTDLGGTPRILAGSTNLPPRIDIGAFEFVPSDPIQPPCEFLFCPSNLVVIAPAGQTSETVTYGPAYATPGAVLNYSPSSGSVFSAGDHSVSVSALFGGNLLNCVFTISVLVSNDFGRVLGTTNLAWETVGDAPWFVQDSVTRDGLAAQSGPITNGQSSTLQAVIPGPATLDFWWRVSSLTNLDFLSISIDGAAKASISGESDWRPQTLYLGAGPHMLRWTYAEGTQTQLEWQGTAWLDSLTVSPGATSPFIVSQPTSLAVAPGRPATFLAAVSGTPPFEFQWLLNGTNLPGATNCMLTITSVQAVNIGTYTLLVTNTAGSTSTIGATLEIAHVVAWGANSFGQTNVPLGLSNVLALAGGYHHSTVLKEDGSILAWGANNSGQTNVPPNLTNSVAIAGRGGDFSMALQIDGTVVVWGDRSYQLLNVPTDLSNVVGIAAGGSHWLALKADGTVTSWGYINTAPVGLSNVVAIAAGDLGNLVLKSDGTIVGWGQPPPPSGVSNIVAIAAGHLHGTALKQDGTVIAWGDNSRGQTNVPVNLSNVVAIAAGDWHCCALKTDGSVVSWGHYYVGTHYVPAVAMLGLSNVVAIAAGSDHDMALLGQHPPVLHALVSHVQRAGNVFTLALPTQSGRIYRLEYRDLLDESPWIPLPLIAGDGKTRLLTDTHAISSTRYYRVRRW